MLLDGVGFFVSSLSDLLQALTRLSNLQSRAFTSYFGCPKELPLADTTDQILAQSNFDLAQFALTESSQRPDAFEVADSIFDLAIGVCAVIGGVYGTKAVRFLKEARAKSKALQEVIEGNELFKKQNPDSADSFKQAQQIQSKETKKLVVGIKA